MVLTYTNAYDCAHFQIASKESFAIAKNSLLWSAHIKSRFTFTISQEKNCYLIYKQMVSRENQDVFSVTLSDVKKSMYLRPCYTISPFSYIISCERTIPCKPVNIESENNRVDILVNKPNDAMTAGLLRQGKQEILNYYFREILKKHDGLKTTFSLDYAPTIYWAVRFNQRESVNDFFARQTYNIDEKYQDGNNLLHVAVLSGNIDIVNLLTLNIKANVNAVNKDDDTALHLASNMGYADVVYFLLAANADPNLKNKDKRTPLSVAASKNNLLTARYLIENKAAVNSRGFHDHAPLATASHYGFVEMVKLLLHYKANPSKKYLYFDVVKTAFDISKDFKVKKILLIAEVNKFIASIKLHEKPSFFSKNKQKTEELNEATVLLKALQVDDKLIADNGLFSKGKSFKGELGLLFQKADKLLHPDSYKKNKSSLIKRLLS